MRHAKRGLILFILNALGGAVPSCSGNIIQEHSFKPTLNCLAALLAANPRPSMQHKCLPDRSETNDLSWQDGTSQTVCSQGLQIVELDIFKKKIVWIKWMNIFRPAYFTPRHWREGGVDIAVWANSRVERKH